MKTLYIICVIVMALVLVFNIGFSLVKKSRFTMNIIHSHLCGLASIFFYMANLFIQETPIALLFYGIYFSLIDWTLFFLLIFCNDITEKPVKGIMAYNIESLLIVLSTFDSVSMMINGITFHSFNITPFYLNNNFFCWKLSYQMPYYIHLLYCYIIIIAAFSLLIAKMIKSEKKYRTKYEYILETVFGLIIINAMFIVSKSALDWSILTYGLISSSLFYFCFIALPKETYDSNFSIIANTINSAIICFDIHGQCIYKNTLAKQIFESNENTFDSPEDYLKNNLSPDELTKLEDRNIDEPIKWDNELFTINGETRCFSGEYHLLLDSKQKVIGSYIQLEDNTEMENLIKMQKHKATHDALTNLYNRNYFFEMASLIITSHPEDQWYFVGTDIENFKLVNEHFGTETGNKILQKQAEMLSLANYKDCIKGRISGDKFAFIIRKSDFNAGLASKNTNKLQEVIKNNNYKIHAYIGVYEVADPYEKITSMFDKAMMAIDSIKGSYEHVIAFYDKELMDKLKLENLITAEFHPALMNGQFNMYLQPQVNISGEAVGAEALIRWNHPEKGLLTPASFISTIEKKGLISQMDEFIWEEAAKKLADWKARGIDWYISVNISAVDFYYKDLYSLFTNLVERYCIDPKKLKLEITETVLMNDEIIHQTILKKLQSYGFTIEMDDFGSGYSSLSTLTKFNMDVLKIDMGFLKNNADYEKTYTILGSIIEMASQLNMQVICEGVETMQQADFLSMNGCNLFQGFYFSTPLPVSEFEKKYCREDK